MRNERREELSDMEREAAKASREKLERRRTWQSVVITMRLLGECQRTEIKQWD